MFLCIHWNILFPLFPIWKPSLFHSSHSEILGMQIYVVFQYLFSIFSTLIQSVLGLSFKLNCVFKSLSVLSDSDWFQWLQELVFHPGYPSQTASVHAMGSGWFCSWSFNFLFLFWARCFQKWQIWQNGDTFNLLVPMPSGRTCCISGGNSDSWNPEESERGLNYRWAAIWLPQKSKI